MIGSVLYCKLAKTIVSNSLGICISLDYCGSYFYCWIVFPCSIPFFFIWKKFFSLKIFPNKKKDMKHENKKNFEGKNNCQMFRKDMKRYTDMLLIIHI